MHRQPLGWFCIYDEESILLWYLLLFHCTEGHFFYFLLSSMKSFIAESVTYLHPDKICDQISDRIVDACLAQDPYSRVAIETVGGHGHISIYGELTTKAELDISKFVKQHYLHLTSKHISVETHVVKQSPQISQGVNIGGAGDQGVMVGYACDENDMYIPHEMYLSRKLLAGVQIDGKSQVTITNGKIESVVLSVQNHTKTQLRRKLKELGINPNVPAYLNNTGAFTIGGFDADSGCTGRKIVVDAYGPRVPGRQFLWVGRLGAWSRRRLRRAGPDRGDQEKDVHDHQSEHSHCKPHFSKGGHFVYSFGVVIWGRPW